MTLRPRIIPCLLLKGAGLVKTIRFDKPTYVGDPINAVKLFNDLEVDELVFLDINATREQRDPNYKWPRDASATLDDEIKELRKTLAVDKLRRAWRTRGSRARVVTSLVLEELREALRRTRDG